ncbi:hypothetical protein CI238_03533 [Colletotrichum incanum]|uniref:Uncharacterized protein n=1 Tax=Colletotrichum incanum TaxID=1573173 RepID=A0A167DWI5_COLIC|nr:hypothetical protein CI238_03533 [Colletotrichum incanum]
MNQRNPLLHCYFGHLLFQLSHFSSKSSFVASELISKTHPQPVRRFRDTCHGLARVLDRRLLRPFHDVIPCYREWVFCAALDLKRRCYLSQSEDCLAMQDSACDENW